MTTLAEIMTTDLITVTPDTLGVKIAEIFENNEFHHIPVVDDNGKLQGIISKSDYLVLCNSMTRLQKDKQKSQNDRFFKSLLASDIMTKDVATLGENYSIKVAAGIFRENLFHAIPVVDKEKNIKGIVTTFDLINYAFKQPAFF